MTNIIQDHGQIKVLNLPQEFQEVEIEAEAGALSVNSIKEFQVSGVDDTRLCLYYRGSKVSNQSAQNFKNILAMKPHVLKDGELDSIREILDDVVQSDIFSTLVTATEVIQEKTVLKVEGTWIQQNWNMYAIYIDASGDGSVVQQVYFLAPKDSYLRYVSGIKNSIKSIQWN